MLGEANTWLEWVDALFASDDTCHVIAWLRDAPIILNKFDSFLRVSIGVTPIYLPQNTL